MPRMSSNNKSIFLSVIFTFLGLVISLYRDVHLSGNISDTSFFVTYISICALITTPLSERMQYGISSKKNYLTLLFASLPILISNIFLWEFILPTSSTTELIYFFGLVQNIFICIVISIMLGKIAGFKGPHVIRIIAPIFPLINILLSLMGINQSFFLVSLSYLGTLLITFIFYYFWVSGKTLLTPKSKSNNVLFEGLFFHYLSFFSAYALVILNVNVLFPNADILYSRLPIYFYVAFSMSLPYLARFFKDVSINKSILLILLNLIFWIVALYLQNNLLYLVVEIVTVLSLSFQTMHMSIKK